MFPEGKFKNNPVDALYYFDHDSLCHVVAALPDPVIARLTWMADQRVRSNIFGAIDEKRSQSIRDYIEREKQPDAEKDDIVIIALTKVVNRLIGEKKIKKDGDFYLSPE